MLDIFAVLLFRLVVLFIHLILSFQRLFKTFFPDDTVKFLFLFIFGTVVKFGGIRCVRISLVVLISHRWNSELGVFIRLICGKMTIFLLACSRIVFDWALLIAHTISGEQILAVGASMSLGLLRNFINRVLRILGISNKHPLHELNIDDLSTII